APPRTAAPKPRIPTIEKIASPRAGWRSAPGSARTGLANPVHVSSTSSSRGEKDRRRPGSRAPKICGLGPSRVTGPAMVHVSTSAPDAQGTENTTGGSDRRISGRRARARDRLMDRANTPYSPNPALAQVEQVENLLLFIDDDLRESALSMERIERYLVSTLDMLEGDSLNRAEIDALAGNEEVLDQIDQLNESLENLRRRVARLARLL